jgi:hypothetical protein
MEFKYNAAKLDQAINLFVEYTRSERYQSESEDRENRKAFFRDLIERPFDEAVFAEIIKKLWASQIFGNKEYLVDKILKDNDIEKLKNKFGLLDKTDISPEKKYDAFIGSVKGMGPSMVTELICYLDPSRAGIWNDKARKALTWIEATQLPVCKYRISGNEYKEVNEFFEFIAARMKKAGYFQADLLLVDYLLWEVWDSFVKNGESKLPTPKPPIKSHSRHDELIIKILEIGSWLGFDVESEKPIAIGSRVDVVWKARIANLGSVSYVFEVQDKGSIDSLILNLQRSLSNPTVHKLIIVSDTSQLEKIKKEVQTMPEDFRKACAYWSDEDVDDTHQSLEQVSTSIAKLNMVNE